MHILTCVFVCTSCGVRNIPLKIGTVYKNAIHSLGQGVAIFSISLQNELAV